MQNHPIFNFENSYLNLPDKFYSLVPPSVFVKPEVFLFNQNLSEDLGLPNYSEESLIEFLLGTQKNEINSFAQAYAGHQFGSFTKLGDGRAIILGEHLTQDGRRFDIQLKGSGRTIYSRGGDGKATLRAMLREYVISEAMHHLKISTSGSLAVIKTGEKVYRETVQEGAALIRIMESHIRVGTFQFAAYLGTPDDLNALIHYTLRRLFPKEAKGENTALTLLNQVMEKQIDLVANWMRVGFIHGVMNTDNVSISGQTFDYGPCAFMNAYHPDTVFSSIDYQGRYAFDNQPRILKWNIARFAEALIPVIHPDQNESLKIAQDAIDGFDAKWKRKYYGMMLRKIGIEKNDSKNYVLVDELLGTMQKNKMDYSNTFFALSQEGNTDLPDHPDFISWLKKWNAAVSENGSIKNAQQLMQKHNPSIIPRNHQVEQALDAAVDGNMGPFDSLLKAISSPYDYQNLNKEFMEPDEESFEKGYQTFCGT